MPSAHDRRPPIIVIGMHRSGTTMVTRVLGQLGVFMGAGLSPNAENAMIVSLNDWLLWQGSAAWDAPEPFLDVLDSEPVSAMSVDYLRLMLGSPRSIGYVGRDRLRHRQTGLSLQGRWGLKDPRMSWTLPLWLRIWPDATVVSVTRHGVDVASSLKVRVDATLGGYEARYRRLRRRYLLRPKHQRMARLVATLRCGELTGAFELWDGYATQAHHHVTVLGPRALEIRYEDLLEDPRPGIAALADFCALPADEAALDAIAAGIDAGRAYAYRSREELCAFAARDDVAATLARHGYASPEVARPRE